MPTKKNYILDTSVCLTDAEAINKFDNHDIFLPLKVLEEIDKHKKRQDSVGINARKIIRALDELRSVGSLQKGVRIAKGKGILKVLSYEDAEQAEFPDDLSKSVPDHIIIATGMFVASQYPRRKTTLVSNDINMRVICDSLGLQAQDYTSEEAVRSSDELYDGFSNVLVDDQIIERFYADEKIHLDEFDMHEPLSPNQYLLLTSNANPKKTCLARFVDTQSPLKKINSASIPDWNIKPRNKEQSFAIDMLMNPDIKLVSLIGRAGSGKTLCAIAAGLQQTIGMDKHKNKYSRLIVSRPVQPMGKDIGFLPGTEEEKMAPWLSAITDSLEVLHKGDYNASGSMSYIMEKANIQFKSVNFMRGRSIQNAIVILDESQNMTASQLKTIITRCGEGTKLICGGNLAQIDSNYLSALTSGLTYLVEKFKHFSGSATLSLDGVVRSRLAEFAEKEL